MIFKLFIIYSILNTVYIYNFLRQKVCFKIANGKNFAINVSIIFSYIFIFFGLFRLLRLFRENNMFDLKNFFTVEKLILLIMLFVLFWFLKRLVLMYIKIVFFRTHYFLLSPNSNNMGVSVFYSNFFLSKIYAPIIKYYRYIKIINIILSIIFIILIIKDLILNNLILNQSLDFLKWYGVFKFCYIIIKFVAIKQDLELDYYAYNYTYPGDFMTGPFWSKLTPEIDNELDIKENKYRFEVIAK